MGCLSSRTVCPSLSIQKMKIKHPFSLRTCDSNALQRYIDTKNLQYPFMSRKIVKHGMMSNIRTSFHEMEMIHGETKDASSRVVLLTTCPICGTEETLQHIGTTTLCGENQST